jgi:hypothetical protein
LDWLVRNIKHGCRWLMNSYQRNESQPKKCDQLLGQINHAGQLHHPHGSSLPGKTLRGAICSRTLPIHQMDAFWVTRPGTLEAIFEHGMRQHQYESTNSEATITHWMLWCQQTWDRQFLSNHRHCLAMRNTIGIMMVSHLECTGVPGYLYIWVDITFGIAPRAGILLPLANRSCFLSQIDSMSTAGWIWKSNFGDVHSLHLTITRVTATVIMNHDSTAYSQWFCRSKNDVVNSLSHDHHLSDAKSPNLLSSCIPKQLQHNFRICQLPQDIVLKITTWLHNLPPSM